MAASEASPPVVVCDAGPLIHLEELGCAALLADFPEVIVPAAVWEEVSRHRPAAFTAQEVRFSRVPIAEVLSPQLEALSRLLALHRGEVQALQAANERPGCLLLADDTAARLAARNLGIPTHGTIGILIRTIRRNQKSKNEVLALLKSLPTASTLHIRASLLAEIIREVEEGP